MLHVGDPRGLWLLAVAALLVLAVFLHARRRVVVESVFFLVRRVVEGLPPGSRRLGRHRLALALFAAAAVAVALAGLAPFYASGDRPLRELAIVDRSATLGTRDGGAPRLALLRAELARHLAGLRAEDAVTFVLAGPRAEALPPLGAAAARRAAAGLDYADAAADVAGAVRLAAGLAGAGAFDRVLLFTDRPARWRAAAPLSPQLRAFGTGAPNAGIVAFDLRRDARRPEVFDLYLRVACPASGGGGAAGVALLNNGREVRRLAAGCGPGAPAEVLADDLSLEPGRVEARLEPGDAYEADDRVLAGVSAAPPLEVVLVTRGERFLRTALESDPAVSLTVADPARPVPQRPGALYVFDGAVPPGPLPDRALFIQPDRPLGALEPRSYRAWPERVLAEGDHPLLRGVDLASLALRGVTTYAGTEEFRAVATADGEPLVLAREDGGRRWVVLAFDPAETNLVYTASFPVLVANALRWLGLFAAGEQGALRVGEPVFLPAAARGGSVLLPDGRSLAVAASRPPAMPLAEARHPGAYAVSAADGTALGEFFLNVLDPAVTAEAGAGGYGAGAAPAPPEPRRGPSRVDFAPWLALAALAFLAAESLLLRRVLARRSRGPRRFLIPALRLAAVAAALAVAAGVAGRKAPEPELVVLADVSASISPAKAAEREAFVEAARRPRPGAAAARVVRFGERDATDLAGAAETAKGLLSGGRPAALLLLSDGEETAGSALASLEGLRAAGVRVLARDLASPAAAPPAVTRLSAPAQVVPGERFDLLVAAQAGEAARLRVVLERDGAPDEARPLALEAHREGEAVFAQQAPRSGLARYRVRLETEAGEPVPAGVRALEVRVAPPFPVTLLTENLLDTRPLRELVEAAGLRTAVLEPESWRMLPEPAGDPGVLVLDNVTAASLGAEGLDRLERLVRERGAGVLCLGGMQSLGAGGYAGTPLERLLPVAMEPPSRGADVELGLVVVLDSSLSMQFQGRGGEAYGGSVPRKIDLARAAVLEIVRVMRPADRLGVLASRDRLTWLRRLAPAGDHAEIEERLRGLVAVGGGINFYSSINEAFEALRPDPAPIRHVMVLADANDIDQLEVESAGRSLDLVRRMADARVTLSIFALGYPSDKDVGFLRQMTQAGRGDFYLVPNTLSLPRYFRAEYQKKTGERFREEAFEPLVRTHAPLLRGLQTDRLPQVAGMNLTAVKNGAEELLVAPFGAPLLASWGYGRGRAAVFAADDGARWARAWLLWPDAERFWTQLVYALARPAPAGPVEARAERAGPEVRLLLRRQDGGFLAAGAGEATLGDAAPAPLERRGLQLFAAPAPAGRGPVTSFAVRGPLLPPGAAVSGVLDEPPPAELRPAGRGRAVLAALVEATGGAFVATPEEAAARAAEARRRFALSLFWTLAVALGALCVEFLLRR